LNDISPVVTIVSAILIVVVLIIAFNLRDKIKKTDSGNEFLPWERQEKMNLPQEVEDDIQRDGEEDYDESEDEDEIESEEEDYDDIEEDDENEDMK